MAEMSSVDFSADVEQHADTIIQVCSYHRRDFDLVVIRSRPHKMQQVQASLESAFETSPTADLGILGRLPPELMWLTLHELDIRSFFRFRQVNRQARIIATGLREYSLVSRYGLEGLRGLLRAELAPYFTISDLYRPLVTDKCVTCGAFGGHLFLFTVERCCFNCLLSSTHYRVLAVSFFAKFARLSLPRLIRLTGPVLRTVPGIYNMLERPARRPKYIIFGSQAVQTLLASEVIHERTAHRLRTRWTPRDYRFMTATAYPYYSVKDAKLERGVSCKGCQIQNPSPHDVVITYDRVFSTRGFLSHFLECEEAQRLWAASETGTQPIDEPEITRSCGYFNRLGPDRLPA
ncbi:hypothetical protein F4861DRAFT_177862 [Xylaria intraflava]|nr:hypothetical protein F4861DRAFT_177862 [Xylaria intraflava]